MVRRRSKVRLALGGLTVLLQLLGSVPASFGLNICVADDGHRALEVGHGDLPCNSDFLRHHPREGLEAEHGLEQHPCEDVEIVGSELWLKSAASGCGPQHIAVSPSRLSARPIASAGRYVGAFNLQCAQTLRARFLRSVVLIV